MNAGKTFLTGLLGILLMLTASCSSDDEGSETGGSGAASGTGGTAGTGTGGTGGTAGTGTGGTGGSAGTGTGGSGGSGGTAGTAGTGATGGSGGNQTGTLAGDVSRTAAIASGQDGMGNVYVMVFDEIPMNQNVTPVGTDTLESADLSMDSSTVPYSIANLPVGQTLYVTAFLDDDDNADPQGPVPASGDLVALMGLMPITVTLSGSGETRKDLPLNVAIP